MPIKSFPVNSSLRVEVDDRVIPPWLVIYAGNQHALVYSHEARPLIAQLIKAITYLSGREREEHDDIIKANLSKV